MRVIMLASTTKQQNLKQKKNKKTQATNGTEKGENVRNGKTQRKYAKENGEKWGDLLRQALCRIKHPNLKKFCQGRKNQTVRVKNKTKSRESTYLMVCCQSLCLSTQYPFPIPCNNSSLWLKYYIPEKISVREGMHLQFIQAMPRTY